MTRPRYQVHLLHVPSASRLYTIDDIRAMPHTENRYETIAGELFVTSAPGGRHQAVLGELHGLLAKYVKRHALGQVWPAPRDVVFGPMTLVQPDLLFVRSHHRDRVTEREIAGPPDLVVEIVSPSTSRTDRGRKRELYRQTGVREYWVVDAGRQLVEVSRPGIMAAEVRRKTVRWQPDPLVEALTVDLNELFNERPASLTP